MKRTTSSAMHTWGKDLQKVMPFLESKKILKSKAPKARTFWLTVMCGDVTTCDDSMVCVITCVHLPFLHKGLTVQVFRLQILALYIWSQCTKYGQFFAQQPICICNYQICIYNFDNYLCALFTPLSFFLPLNF